MTAAEPQWQRNDRAFAEAARRLEDQGIYGSTTQAIQQEADALLAQWDQVAAADEDGAAR